MNTETAFSEIPLVPTAGPVVGPGRTKWFLVAVFTLIAVGTAALYFSRSVPQVDPTAPPVIVEVSGMHCPIQCGLRVTSALESLPWVVPGSVSANPKTGIVTFTVSDGEAVSEAEIRRVIERAGFGVGSVKFR